MKQLLMTMALLFFVMSSTNANESPQTEIVLQVCCADNPYIPSKPKERGLDLIPHFYLEGRNISFEQSNYPFTLYIYKGDTMVYLQEVPSGINQIEIPSSLEGSFMLMIIYKNIAYSGEIHIQ